MLNVVVPMAGRGSRFAREGFRLPKPLIAVRGRPMVELVIANLRPAVEHRFVFLCLEDHLHEFALEDRLSLWAPGCEIVPVCTVTDGAACTVLLARHLIDTDDPLMIANSDQWVDVDIDHYLDVAARHDGLIMTMWADDPKWSFVRMDGKRVTEVVEKEVVSNDATVGIYNFARGCDFVRAADDMIADDARVNGEFYVAPAYNWMIRDGADIGTYNVGEEGRGLYGLGIPADLARFLDDPACDRALRAAQAMEAAGTP